MSALNEALDVRVARRKLKAVPPGDDVDASAAVVRTVRIDRNRYRVDQSDVCIRGFARHRDDLVR